MQIAAVEPQDFRIRCSAVGSIMADPKEGQILPQGAKTYVKKWYIEQTTGEQFFKGNKYTKKGWEVEDDAIEVYSEVTGYDQLVKNKKFFGNDFTEGTPDILVGDDLVTDIKCPWHLDTFYKYSSYIPTAKYPAPNSNYFWQLQAYMLVAERTKSELAYVLMNTPKHLLQSSQDIKQWINYEIEYSLKERVKIFVVDRSNSHICRIEERVKLCREYLSEIIQQVN
ncbi:MAG: YqaJ viral recombinase family protein [Oleispira sp.]|nr:YqaJ viral recombinase family protein [Oleispira sp.]